MLVPEVQVVVQKLGVAELTTIEAVDPKLVVAVLFPVVEPTPTGVLKLPSETKGIVAVPPPLSIVIVILPE
jgi:hypothetical protein